MAKKPKYEPHPRLVSKVSDSQDRQYNRQQNQSAIEEQLEDKFAEEIEAELYDDKFLSEHGFHITNQYL